MPLPGAESEGGGGWGRTVSAPPCGRVRAVWRRCPVPLSGGGNFRCGRPQRGGGDRGISGFGTFGFVCTEGTGLSRPESNADASGPSSRAARTLQHLVAAGDGRVAGAVAGHVSGSEPREPGIGIGQRDIFEQPSQRFRLGLR